MRVDAVAEEAAAEMIVEAAAGHASQRERAMRRARRVAGIAASAQQQVECRPHAETSAPPPKPPLLARRTPRRCVAARRSSARRRARRRCASPAARSRSAASSCSFCARTSSRVLRRTMRARASSTARNAACRSAASSGSRCPEERHAVGRQEHRQRPAAAALRKHLVRELVDLVEVGPLLAVDLDVDEERVHRRARSPHPRTTRAPSRGTSGRRSSRSKAGSACSALRAGGERLVAPGLPVDRIVRVLAQVRAGFAGEAVGHDGAFGFFGSLRATPRLSRRRRAATVRRRR